MSYIFFARWFGLISVILSLGILFNLEDAQNMAKHMLKTEAGYILGGVLPIIFGSLSFMHHNSFAPGWGLGVTLIGLFMVIVGAYRVIFVKQWMNFIGKHIDQIPYLFSLFGLMLGVFMLYIGFISTLVQHKFG